MGRFSHILHGHRISDLKAARLGYGVVSTRVPGMATSNALDPHPTTLYYTILFHSFQRVVGTSWKITAGATQHWRNEMLVETNDANNQSTHGHLQGKSNPQPVRPDSEQRPLLEFRILLRRPTNLCLLTILCLLTKTPAEAGGRRRHRSYGNPHRGLDCGR
jgi:hypothetical protein